MNGVDKIVQQLADWCQQRPLRLCLLFGSQATGKTHPHSDVDIAIWPEAAPTSQQKLNWINELAQLLNEEINLVLVSPDLDPVLGFELVKHGQVVFERDTGFWQKEKNRLWHLYVDSWPFRLAGKELQQFIQESWDGFMTYRSYQRF